MTTSRLDKRAAILVALIIPLLWLLARSTPALAADAPFSATLPIATTFDGPYSVHAADVDGDGDLDVLGAALNANTIAWWENTAGDGSAWTQQVLSSTFDGAWSVDAADVDGDGDLDVLGAAWTANTIAWWENTAGDGSAWTQHVLSSTFNAAASVQAADVDGDGDMDVLGAAEFSNTIAWWENVAGDGSAWTQHVVSSTFTGACSAHAADLDGDGDLDVLGAALNANTIAWWENTTGDGSAWTQQVLSSTFDGAWSVDAADVDGDGDLDVLGAAWTGDTIAWWENTAGDGSAWTQHVLSSTFDGAVSVKAADLDGDGDMDVLGATFDTDTIAWWRNETIHRSAAYPPEGMHTLNTAYDYPFTAHAADVDGDGDLDVLGGSYSAGTINWWENTAGDGSGWTERLVGSGGGGVRSVYAADLDGDGDLDVLGARYTSGSYTTAWWENTAGDGSAWTQHTLDNPYGYAITIRAADLDGDGDLDVLNSWYSSDLIGWWENTAGDASAWTLHTVSFDGAWSVDAADVDGDGDLDILGSAWSSSTIAWWENTGSGTFDPTPNVLTSSFTSATSVYAADVDGDGDLDVLGAATNAFRFAWWENTAGDGSAWTEHNWSGTFYGAQSIYAADLDVDGDLDVLGAWRYAVTIWENTAGDGSAWAERTVSSTFNDVESIYAADLDGDGDPDVLSVSSSQDTIAWWQNRGGQFALATTATAPAEMVSGTLDDMLRVTMTPRGRAGDADEEWATLELSFSGSEVPLTSGEANALIETLFVYRDDGSGTFEPGADTAVTAVDTLELVGGRQTVAFLDGDPLVQVAHGTPRTYFVVVELTPNAYIQRPDRWFSITHVTDPAGGATSTAEDRDHDLALTLEYAADVTAGVTCGAQADLALTKTASDASLVPGQPLTYTLVYVNNGPSTAVNGAPSVSGTIVITDLLPALLIDPAFTTSDPGLTLRGGAPFSWELWSLAPGQGGVITVTGIVSPALLSLTPIVNSAQIAAETADPLAANNTMTVTGTVVEIPIYGLAAANDSPTTLGQPTWFTAIVTAGTNVAYAWSFGDGQCGSGSTVSHVYAAAGAYTAVVTASNSIDVATATTVVTVTNLAPTADAGLDQAVLVNAAVTLDGSASTDPDGHLPLAYGWVQTSGPSVVLSNPACAQPTFTASPVPAVLAFTLAVTDAFGLPDPTPDSVVVTVGDEPVAGLSLTTSSPTPFGQPTWFTATVTAGTNVEFAFDWGDGESGLEGWKGGRVEGWKEATLQPFVVVSHTYALAGEYTVVVTAANGAGQQSMGATVVITSPPTCLAPVSGVTVAGLPDAFLDLTWFFSATVEPAAATPPITFTWSPEPAAGQGTAYAAYSWSQTGTVTLTVTAENCGGMASASFAVDVQAGVAITVEPGMTHTLVYTDPLGITSTVTIPPDAVPEEMTLVLTPKPTSTHPISPSLAFGGLAFRLDAWLGQQFLPGYVFDRPVPVTIGYSDQAVANLQEDQLKLYRWSGTAWRDGAETCSPPAGYVRDLANNRFTTAICQLSEWNIQGPASIRIYYAYLPVVVPARLYAPDLVVERLTAGSDNVQVVIRNQGTAAARRPFWVDVYVDPSPPPTHVNQIWEQLGEQGLVWGLGLDGLSILPGQAITLTVDDRYFWPDYSHVAWPLPAGTPLYAQVDSAYAGSSYGAVREVDEIRGDPYNNIVGPVYVVPGALELPIGRPSGPPPNLRGLPPRR